MLSLSAESINYKAPYKVWLGDINSFYFTTGKGVTYNVGFVCDYMLADEGVYQFYIVDVNHAHAPKDPLVKQTILCVIEEFFKHEPNVMLYICDTSDTRQGMRSRLFRRWFEEYEHHTLFTMINEDITFDGVVYYGSIILKNTHPQYNDLVNKFHTVIEELPRKIEEIQSEL